tara:strand:- start:368 stop:529 length:162 start_codon:yes stop_codon:yes gene_type:complete
MSKVDINDIVNVIIEQRNNALNTVAELTATVALLKKKLEGGQKNETDTKHIDT